MNRLKLSPNSKYIVFVVYIGLWSLFALWAFLQVVNFSEHIRLAKLFLAFSITVIWIIVIHELIHVAILQYYGIQYTWRFSSRTGYNPQIHFLTDGLTNKQVTLILLLPTMITIIIGALMLSHIGMAIAFLGGLHDFNMIFYLKEFDKKLRFGFQMLDNSCES